MFQNAAFTALTFDLYGLAFFVMGVAVLAILDHQPGLFFTRHLRLLSLYGISHGLSGFAAGIAFSADSVTLGWIILVLRAVAFAALLEFARRHWNDRHTRTRLSPLIIAGPIALIALFSTTVANLQAGIDAGLRYFLYLPAGLLTSKVMFDETREPHEALRTLDVTHWLRTLSLTFLALSALSLPVVLTMPEYRWLPSSAQFREITGIPIQLLNTVCALIIAAIYIGLMRRTAGFVFRQSIINETLATNEGKYRALFEKSSDAILTFNKEAFIEVNMSCVKMLGFTRPEDLSGKRLTDISPPLQPDGSASDLAIYSNIMQALDKGTYLFEWQLQRRDGSTFPSEIRLTPMLSQRDRIIQAIIRDISASKHAQMELQEHREHLEELVLARTAEMQQARIAAESANAAKSAFLSRMSHELRTPLNAIIGFGQLMQLDDEPSLSNTKEYANHIVDAGNHLLSLVNDLLDLNRIESGQMVFLTRSVAVMPLLRQVVEQLTPLADARGISLLLPEDEGCYALADETRLRQVLLNLLSNAIKYSHEASVIRLTLMLTETRLRISVHDQGPGLSAEEISRLFQPFERLGAAATKIEGTGIGLMLTKHLVEAMGGQVGVLSTPGQGSEFWFELPRSGLSTASSLPGTSTPRSAHPAVGTRTLLYIEDNPVNLRLLERWFATLPGYRFLAATSAEQGLMLLKHEVPDVVLMDIHLPGMDGYQALKALRALPGCATLPVIAVTANAMADDVAEGQAAGFTDYLIKPLDLVLLLDTLERHLSQLNAQG